MPQRTLGRFILDIMNIKSEGQNEQIRPFNVGIKRRCPKHCAGSLMRDKHDHSCVKW